MKGIGAANEFALAAACAIWPPSPGRIAAIRQAAGEKIDWPRLLRVSQRQRIHGLVYQGLREADVHVPSEAMDWLAARAKDIAAMNIVLGLESFRLQTLLDQAAIANLVLKGVTLAPLAYGDANVKFAWDIDMLVKRDQVHQAMAAIAREGYLRVFPGPALTEKQLATFIDLSREMVFRHPARNINVELKWVFDANPLLVRGIAVDRNTQTVEIGEGRALRTLGKDDLFAYLCVHAARHCFARLKWLADIAALLSHEPPQEIERLYRAAANRGAARPASVALLLAERFLKLEIPPAVRASMDDGWAVRRLFSGAVFVMAGGDGQTYFYDRRFVQIRMALLDFLLPSGLRGLMAEARIKWVSIHDRMHIALPPWADFLYPLVRIPMFLWRRVMGQRRQTESG